MGVQWLDMEPNPTHSLYEKRKRERDRENEKERKRET